MNFKKVWWPIVWTHVKEFFNLPIEHSVVKLETWVLPTQDVIAYARLLLWCGNYNSSRFTRISAINRMLSNSYGHSASPWTKKKFEGIKGNIAGVNIKTYSNYFPNISFIFYICTPPQNSSLLSCSHLYIL